MDFLYPIQACFKPTERFLGMGTAVSMSVCIAPTALELTLCTSLAMLDTTAVARPGSTATTRNLATTGCEGGSFTYYWSSH